MKKDTQDAFHNILIDIAALESLSTVYGLDISKKKCAALDDEVQEKLGLKQKYHRPQFHSLSDEFNTEARELHSVRTLHDIKQYGLQGAVENDQVFSSYLAGLFFFNRDQNSDSPKELKKNPFLTVQRTIKFLSALADITQGTPDEPKIPDHFTPQITTLNNFAKHSKELLGLIGRDYNLGSEYDEWVQKYYAEASFQNG